MTTMKERMARALFDGENECLGPDFAHSERHFKVAKGQYLTMVNHLTEAMMEPDEVTLGNVGPMEGFDTDLFEHDMDRPHIEWWKAMLTTIKEGGE